MLSCEYNKICKRTYFILLIICERLLLPLKVIYKDFVGISYQNASFGILEDSIWLQLIYFLTIIAFCLMKYIFRIDGNNLRVLTEDMAVRVYRAGQPL